ncbi:MAG: TIGR00730 family Rossman fold protein [Bacteroidales bacterium]|nr:TIGR00730 family Rossman fold protein [Bacteroidales bacterium]
MNVAVFAASSNKTKKSFRDAASRLGNLFVENNITAVYGGGGIGLMGDLADAMLQRDGKIIGVIPRFMVNEGWGHQDVTDMIVTETMSERKDKIFEISDAVVALPGGIGTLEELSQAITQKQLSLWNGPIVWINTDGFYDKLIAHFENMMSENLMSRQQSAMWNIVDSPEDAINAILNYKESDKEWRKIAKIG